MAPANPRDSHHDASALLLGDAWLRHPLHHLGLIPLLDELRTPRVTAGLLLTEILRLDSPILPF